jgi:SAM-dependent methyltransferase
MATPSPRPVQSVTNIELYNRWAKVYDTDGNILQALDDALLPSLLSNAFSLISSTTSTILSPITITELGAGTGRNTIKLLDPSLPVPIARIAALDLSPSMLDIARQRCKKFTSALPTTTPGSKVPEIGFYEFDALHPSDFPSANAVEGQADLILSTLVLEHLPLPIFFSTAKKLLKKEGGYFVVTNMHAEMGRKGQAGFVDEGTGERVRGDSFVYEIGEVLEEGRRWGFQVVGPPVGERDVGEEDVGEEDVGEERLLGKRGMKWIGVKCWFGFVMRFGGEV